MRRLPILNGLEGTGVISTAPSSSVVDVAFGLASSLFWESFMNLVLGVLEVTQSS